MNSSSADTANPAASTGSLEADVTTAGYLFVTFKGESTPLTEQVYFAVSRDGRHWDALRGAEPILVSGLGDKGVRDPFIIRSADGSKFFIIATDLNIHLNPDWGRAVRAGSQSLIVWESLDLIHWSEPRAVRVAPPGAGCTWAPEAIYDEERENYLVFWASTSKSDDYAKHRMWASRTRDFHTFSEPFIYCERSASIIDMTIVRSGGKYFRFSKDEVSKGITQEVSANLAGPWSAVDGFSLTGLHGYEGPQCFPLQPRGAGVRLEWCLLLDHYSQGQGYQPYITSDLERGQFSPGEGFSFPFRFRHGSVLCLTNDELTRLQA